MIHAPVEGRFRVRSDRWGDGAFGTSRGLYPGGSKKYHDGVDIVVVPGQNIIAPMSGKVVKVDYPYASDLSWKGIQIETPVMVAEVWYMEPYHHLIGTDVVGGVTIVGRAQDISLKYGVDPEKGLMTPHVHFRLSLKPLAYMVDHRWGMSNVIIDPLEFIGKE